MSLSAQDVINELQHTGLRITTQRHSIIEHILRMPAHFSADELLAELHNGQMEVSRATVYRLLPKLVQLGVVREVIYGEEHRHYEVVGEDQQYHGHLICEQCGRVIDFICPAVEGAIIGVCREYRFRHHSHTLEISGLCEDCQAQLHNN